MFFRKSDRKNGHFGIKLAVCALATIGAIGIVKGGKDWICAKGEQVAAMFRPKKKCQPPECSEGC